MGSDLLLVLEGEGWAVGSLEHGRPFHAVQRRIDSAQ